MQAVLYSQARDRLKENLAEYYSRKITDEHGLVYKIVDDLIIIAQCRYHY